MKYRFYRFLLATSLCAGLITQQFPAQASCVPGNYTTCFSPQQRSCFLSETGCDTVSCAVSCSTCPVTPKMEQIINLDDFRMLCSQFGVPFCSQSLSAGTKTVPSTDTYASSGNKPLSASASSPDTCQTTVAASNTKAAADANMTDDSANVTNPSCENTVNCPSGTNVAVRVDSSGSAKDKAELSAAAGASDCAANSSAAGTNHSAANSSAAGANDHAANSCNADSCNLTDRAEDTLDQSLTPHTADAGDTLTGNDRPAPAASAKNSTDSGYSCSKSRSTVVIYQIPGCGATVKVVQPTTSNAADLIRQVAQNYTSQSSMPKDKPSFDGSTKTSNDSGKANQSTNSPAGQSDEGTKTSNDSGKANQSANSPAGQSDEGTKTSNDSGKTNQSTNSPAGQSDEDTKTSNDSGKANQSTNSTAGQSDEGTKTSNDSGKTNQSTNSPAGESDKSTNTAAQSDYAVQITQLVNQERAKQGLSPVTLDTEITKAAQVRANETITSFSHTRPNGSSFSSVLKEHGISYRGCGENIAWGQKSPEDVMNAWMNSEGHRANILNPNFKYLGVGYAQSQNGTKYWSQLFTY